MEVSRRVVLAVVLVLAAAPVGAALGTSGAPGGGPVASTAAESDATQNGTPTSAGEAFSSALDTRGRSVRGALATETFRTRIRAVEGDAAAARTIADALERTRSRTAALEDRSETLRRARANGSLSAEGYVVRVAPVASEARELRALLGAVADAIDRVDDTELREAGVEPEDVERLGDRVAAVASASANASAAEGVDAAFYGQVATAADRYNDRVGDRDLGVLGAALDGERVNLHVVDADGDDAVISFRMTETERVRDLRAGPHPAASVRVTTSEATARGIVESDDPVAAASRAYLDGDVAVRGIGLQERLRWAVVDVALSVVRWLVEAANWVSTLL